MWIESFLVFFSFKFIFLNCQQKPGENEATRRPLILNPLNAGFLLWVTCHIQIPSHGHVRYIICFNKQFKLSFHQRKWNYWIELHCKVSELFCPHLACAISPKAIRAHEWGEWGSTNPLCGGGLKASLVNFSEEYPVMYSATGKHDKIEKLTLAAEKNSVLAERL